jgi:hypothetical protein
MNLTTAYRPKEITLTRKDGTVCDTFTMPAASEWPQVVIFGVADARRTFIRDKGGRYVEASHVMSPMPVVMGF